MMTKRTIDPSYDGEETLKESLEYAKENGESELNGLFSVVSASVLGKLRQKYGISSKIKNSAKAFIRLYLDEYCNDGVEYDDFYSQLLIDINDINEEEACENGEEKIRTVLNRYDRKTIRRFVDDRISLPNILLNDYLNRTLTHISGIDDYCDELEKILDNYK